MASTSAVPSGPGMSWPRPTPLTVASKLAWNTATNSTLAPVALYSHGGSLVVRCFGEQRCGQADLGEHVGQVPQRERDRDEQAGLQGTVAVLQPGLQKPHPADLLGQLEQGQLEQQDRQDPGEQQAPVVGQRLKRRRPEEREGAGQDHEGPGAAAVVAG